MGTANICRAMSFRFIIVPFNRSNFRIDFSPAISRHATCALPFGESPAGVNKRKSLKSGREIFRVGLEIKMMGHPAGDRNKGPILEVLKKHIDPSAKSNLLEISSGPGLHVCFFAKHFPNTTFYPSEYMRTFFVSINAFRESYAVNNVAEPVFVDISKDLSDWVGKFGEKEQRDCEGFFDFVLSINMIHITSIECAQGLFINSSKLLKPGGLLFTYGTFMENGILEPLSNFLFDQRLRINDPTWGVRDVVELQRFAEANAMRFLDSHVMPSDSKCLVWMKNQ